MFEDKFFSIVRICYFYTNHKFITMKKIVFYLLGLFAIISLNACTSESLDEEVEQLINTEFQSIEDEDSLGNNMRPR
ncbi:hypothetical protein GCM10022396_24120 [Flavivirga amylovorans]